MSKKHKRKGYFLYTDGACNTSSRNREGAYSYILLNSDGTIIKKYTNAQMHTTNNKMELKAIIEGCKSIPDGSEVTVFSDSQYALGVLSGRWNAKLNLDIIALHESNKKRLTIHYKWVKGHSNNEYNDLCDKMANNKMSELISDYEPYIHKYVPVSKPKEEIFVPTAPSPGKRICRLSDDEFAVLEAYRNGEVKIKKKIEPKPKRTPQTPEQKKAHKRAYYIANKDTRKAYATQYYQLHKEQCKQKQRNYYAKKKQQYLQERSLSTQA